MDEHKSDEKPLSSSQNITPNRLSETDDYEAASKSTADYASFNPKKNKKLRSRKSLFIVLSVLLLAFIGAGLWWQFGRHKSAAPSNSTQATSKPSNSNNSEPQSAIKISSKTKTFASKTFALSFNYPEDWTASETTSQVVVKSPSVRLPDVNNAATNAQIVFTISQKGQNLTPFDAGNAVAVHESQKIAYTKPTGTQRANTYLSFLRYAKTTNNGALDGIYITGDIGYQKDQEAPKIDIAKADPLISVTFLKCADSQCASAAQALSVNANIWQDNNFSKPILQMLTSLAIN